MGTNINFLFGQHRFTKNRKGNLICTFILSDTKTRRSNTQGIKAILTSQLIVNSFAPGFKLRKKLNFHSLGEHEIESSTSELLLRYVKI